MQSDKYGGLSFIAPALTGGKYHHAQVLGNCVWLWMNSGKYMSATLEVLKTQLLPPLEKGQFALAFDSVERPACFVSWAYFDAAAEAEYIRHGNRVFAADPSKWNCGERLWIVYFMAATGYTRHFNDWLYEVMFARTGVRFLYHQGNQRGLKVFFTGGKMLSGHEIDSWHERHPLLVDAPVFRQRRSRKAD